MSVQCIQQAVESAEEVTIEPLPLVGNAPEGLVFPVETLPSFWRDTIEAIQEQAQAPLAIAGQSVLAALNLATQAHANVKLPTGQIRPVSCFFLTIAASGERKSACDTEAMRPITAYEESLRLAYSEQLQKFHNAKEVWESERRKILNAVKKSHTEKTQLLDNMGKPPQKPPPPVLTCPDPTIEGLTKLLGSGRPFAGLFTDEGGRFLGSYGMGKETRLRTITGLTSLWDGSDLRRIRASEEFSVFANRRFCMHLMVQPEIARNFLFQDGMSEEQGILSRILPASPMSDIGKRPWQDPTLSAGAVIENYTEKLVQLLRISVPVKEHSENELQPRTLTLTESAREAFIAFYNETEHALGSDNSYREISGLANKLPEHAARLAATVTLADNLYAASIDLPAMQAGIALARFYAHEAMRLKARGCDPQLNKAERLRKWMLEQWKEPYISLPDIYQSNNFVRTQKAAKHLVRILEEHGWLLRVMEPMTVAGKRRREVWRINRE